MGGFGRASPPKTPLSSPLTRQFPKKHKMREIIYGRNPVYESLRAKRREGFRLQVAEGVQERGRLTEILDLRALRKIPVERVPRARLDKLSDSHQGVALEVSGYPYVGLDDILENASARNEALFVLILDTLQNPQNLGTLIRTAEAVGVHGIVIPTHRAAEITPAVVSASAGATEHMLVVQTNLVQAMLQFKQADAWVVGLDESPESQSSCRSAVGWRAGGGGRQRRRRLATAGQICLRFPAAPADAGTDPIAERLRGRVGGAVPGIPGAPETPRS